MNCELAQERIVLAAYGELADELVHELDRHLAICPECGREREQVQALQTLAGAYAVAEPDANLVARARIRLEEALDALPPKAWLERSLTRWGNGFAGLRAAPVAAGFLLVAGLGSGAWAGYEFAAHRVSTSQTAPQVAQVAVRQEPAAASGQEKQQAAATELDKVANISSIVRDPHSRMVEVRYNRVEPQQVRGSLDDPGIQRLLMVASQRANSTGARDNSVELLAAECRASHGCRQPGLRDALMMALRYGQDAEVRQKALEGLEPLVAEDVRVRNAVLEALLNDNDPRIRTISINVLQPVEGDTSVREVLYSVSNSDENPQIRNVSRQMLSHMPEIQ